MEGGPNLNIKVPDRIVKSRETTSRGWITFSALQWITFRALQTNHDALKCEDRREPAT
jgi:hypothetical protein